MPSFLFHESFCKQHISTKAYKAYFHYIKTHHPDVDLLSLCKEAGLPYEYLLNEDNWVSVIFDHQFTYLCIAKCKDTRLCYKVGAQALSEEVVGKPLFYFAKYSLSLPTLYSQLPRLTALFNKVTKCQIKELRRGFSHLTLSADVQNLNEEEVHALKLNFHNIFENTLGHFSLLPTCKGLPPAKEYFDLSYDAQGLPTYEIQLFYEPLLSLGHYESWIWHLLSVGIFTATIFGFNKSIISGLIAGSFFESCVWFLLYRRKYKNLKGNLQSTIDHLNKLDEKYLVIYESKKNLALVSQSYERFVPKQLLEHLKKRSIVDVQLGDVVESEMTVLFVDIRGFTQIVEDQMAPISSFLFLNQFFSIVAPIIHRYQGFIERYTGDGFLAVFPNEANDAVVAATEIVSKVRLTVPHLNIGIGINTGPLILGVLGMPQQMQGSVISDSVNIASRLEALTKDFGVRVIAGENTIKKLDVKRLNFRDLGLAQIRGKKIPVQIYHIYEGEGEDTIKCYNETKSLFEKGVSLFNEGHFAQALLHFQDVLGRHPSDRACSQFLKMIKARFSYIKKAG